MTETQEEIQEVESYETLEETFKQSLAALLYSFIDIAGEGKFLSVNGVMNERPFCVSIAVDEEAERIHKLFMEQMNEE